MTSAAPPPPEAEAAVPAPLLEADEPPPVRWLRPESPAPLLLVCEHAGYRLPRALGDLGLPPGAIARHIGWDIGAAAVTERLSDLLEAPALLSVYSRLAIDLNRALDDPTLMAQESDRTMVPGNRGLTPAVRQWRIESLFRPFHEAAATHLTVRTGTGQVPAVIDIHSFTPVMNGFARPWQVGVLWNRDPRIALPLLAALRAEGDLTVGDNEPYSARTGPAALLTDHAEPAGLPAVMLEIRQDLIADAAGAAAWAERLARLLRPILALPDLSVPRFF